MIFITVLALLTILYLYKSRVYLFYRPTLLNESIINACPSIRKRRFFFTPYLFSGLLQAWFSQKLQCHYTLTKFKRQYIDFGEDFGYFALDWGFIFRKHKIYFRYQDGFLDESQADQPNGLPIVVVLSGLTASKTEPYIVNLFTEATKDTRYRIVLINDRLYNNREYLDPTRNALPTQGYMNYVEDFRRIFLYLTEKYKDSEFFGIGHSFGANTLTRYLGICGSNKITSGFKACVSICNPYDFQVGIRLIDSFSNRFIRYHRQKIVKLKIKQFEQNAERLKLNFNDIFQAKTAYEYDQNFTSKVFGAPTVDYHFLSVQCINHIDEIDIPVFFIGSQDDPIVLDSVVPYRELKKNKNFIVLMTQVGGHISWIEGLKPKRWYTKPVLEYIRYFIQNTK